MSDDGSKTPSPKSENVPTSSKTNMAVDKKHSHSEIEKRRRDKMNEYINDLSTMIPLPPSVGKKPDKLTVLRFTVQHMKALQGSTEPVIETKHKPGFLSDDDVRNLIAEAAGGFLIVVECDRGQVLYVTGSVEEMLNISQADMMGYNFYQLVHSKDVPVIKVQLATTTADSKEEKNDSKNGLLLREGMEKSENLCPGAKRSFICRMKKGAKMDDKKNMETTSSIRKTKANLQLMNENDSVLISYEGYLKSWPPKKDVASGSDQNSRSCLVAVGRVVEVDNEQTDYGVLGQICEFETRQRADATFVRVDHSFTKIFGYCSDEVVGKSAYSFIYKDDLKVVTEAHHKALNNKSNSRPEVIYRFRAKAGHYLPLKTVSAVFRNPFSKEIDLIVTRNVVISHMLPNTMSITSLQRAQNTISTVQELEMDENLRDLLRKVDNLETNETKFQRKRGFNSKATESEKIESPSDIGVLLAEQAKKIGQQLKLKPQSAKYSNVASPGKENPQQTSEVTSHSARSMNDRRQFENADEINTTTLEQTMGDGILIEQLTGIQGAIDMMENTGVNDEDYSMSLLMSVLENEDLGNVFNDMPWNLM